MLTIGLVPASLREYIVENYAMFLPGRRDKNFISIGFFAFFNLFTISLILNDFTLIPTMAGVLGGLSIATLVMLLTLRSIRSATKRAIPA